GYQPLGLVMGSCVYHVGHRDFTQWASSQTANSEMPSYTAAFYEARELAMSRMQVEGENLHADGIVGVSVTHRSHIWGSRIIEFFAIGTAVKAPLSESVPAIDLA